ncbi:hypothetical protein [Sulfobacillus thermosulfidooxidans]|uniref:hypothetical protein n=1 Tax=Sulfobacillus thermosulfidooxidans TaxID=28034 RepID=UPI0006B4B901|nr:hypothetical protein [Sulfobacillus thermosulfidooxidans]
MMRRNRQDFMHPGWDENDLRDVSQKWGWDALGHIKASQGLSLRNPEDYYQSAAKKYHHYCRRAKP